MPSHRHSVITLRHSPRQRHIGREERPDQSRQVFLCFGSTSSFLKALVTRNTIPEPKFMVNESLAMHLRKVRRTVPLHANFLEVEC